MRIFLAGGTGAIGRPLVPALLESGHTVFGISRSQEGASWLLAQGAIGLVCDVYDAGQVEKAVDAATPDLVMNQLTDLPDVMEPERARERLAANQRIRTEGAANLIAASVRAGVYRYLLQSVAFQYTPEGPLLIDEDATVAEATREAEGPALDSLDAVVLRYGYFYGPDTYYNRIESAAARVRPDGVLAFVHIEDAVSATLLAINAPSGIYNVVDDTTDASRATASNAKFKQATGWRPMHPGLNAS